MDGTQGDGIRLGSATDLLEGGAEAPDEGINAAQSMTERPQVGHMIHDGGDEGVEDENGGVEAGR
jgi:hypothetical protein